jgi:hypothetical protein
VGANSQQGVALLVFLVAFTFLSVAMFYGGNIVFLVLAAVTLAASIGMFLKAKPLEERG